MKEFFLQNGFNDFLPKPIDIVSLNTILERWLPKSKQKRGAIYYSRPTLSTAFSPEAVIEIEGLDVAKGILLAGGSATNYYEILCVFCDDGAERIVMMKDCLDAGDLDLYTTCVHALKSASANVGADKLSQAAYALEMAGARGDLAYISENNAAFVAALQTLISNIDDTLSSSTEYLDRPAEPMNNDQFADALIRLKTALEKLNISDIDGSVESLMASAQASEEKSAIKNISKHVLMGEHDEAIALIDSYLESIE
jgi:HPt (histidine-containing phosphotransfer) domain-containing protein